MERDQAEAVVKVPSGFRFAPRPEELLVDYLRPRLLNEPLPCQIIQEKNIYDFHPRDLLGDTPPGEHLYFFTPRKKLCPNGTRPIRTANGGYWKASTAEKIIKNKYGKEIGCKRFLVFHQGRQPKGVKTDWLMHEYIIKKFWLPIEYNEDELGTLALCEIYEKENSKSKQSKNDNRMEEKGSPQYLGNEEDMDNMNADGSLQNILVDRRVSLHPTPRSHGNTQAKGSVPSPKACLSDSSPLEITTMMGMPSPSMLNFYDMGYDSHQVRLLFPHYQDAHSFGFDGINGFLQPEALSILKENILPMASVQLGASEHSLSLESVSSFPFHDSIGLPFNGQLMSLPQHMQLSKFGIATDPSSQDQLLFEQLDFLANQYMLSSFQSSPLYDQYQAAPLEGPQNMLANWYIRTNGSSTNY